MYLSHVIFKGGSIHYRIAAASIYHEVVNRTTLEKRSATLFNTRLIHFFYIEERERKKKEETYRYFIQILINFFLLH